MHNAAPGDECEGGEESRGASIRQKTQAQGQQQDWTADNYQEWKSERKKNKMHTCLRGEVKKRRHWRTQAGGYLQTYG